MTHLVIQCEAKRGGMMGGINEDKRPLTQAVNVCWSGHLRLFFASLKDSRTDSDRSSPGIRRALIIRVPSLIQAAFGPRICAALRVVSEHFWRV
jgi:hypothetical protein